LKESLTAEYAEIAEWTALAAVRAAPVLCAIRSLCGEMAFSTLFGVFAQLMGNL